MTNWEKEVTNHQNNLAEQVRQEKLLEEQRIQKENQLFQEQNVIPGFKLLDKLEIPQKLEEIRDQIWKNGELISHVTKEGKEEEILKGINNIKPGYLDIYSDDSCYLNIGDRRKRKYSEEMPIGATYSLVDLQRPIHCTYLRGGYDGEITGYDEILKGPSILSLTSDGTNLGISYLVLKEPKLILKQKYFCEIWTHLNSEEPIQDYVNNEINRHLTNCCILTKNIEHDIEKFNKEREQRIKFYKCEKEETEKQLAKRSWLDKILGIK